MPPWDADPKYGRFVNDLSLSEAEKRLLEDWVENGVPEGDAKDLPKPERFTPGWRIAKPDRVIQMPTPYRVPATGVLP